MLLYTPIYILLRIWLTQCRRHSAVDLSHEIQSCGSGQNLGGESFSSLVRKAQLSDQQLPPEADTFQNSKVNMIPTAIRRALQSKPATEIYTSPYKAKRSWPPDFSKLTPKHQFRLERRYKRRVKLKWARPKWTKAVKLAQFGSIVCKEELSL